MEVDITLACGAVGRAAVPSGASTGTREALADVDLVVEAIAEELEIKRELFSDLDRICKPEAIMASNTSFLDIDEIQARDAGDLKQFHGCVLVPTMGALHAGHGALSA